MLFFFFFSEPYYRVKIRINFECPSGQNPSLDDLNEFLDAVSRIHEFAIINTQPEYLENNKSTNQDLKVFEYHKLEVLQFCRKNPFDLELSFFILKEGLVTYWPFIKALIFMCKRYGSNSTHLIGTINFMRIHFDLFFERLMSNVIFNKLFGLDKKYNDKEKLFTKLISNLLRLMSDPKFRMFYNKICMNFLNITSLVSSVEELKEEIDLLND
jgi:hypothetical protein